MGCLYIKEIPGMCVTFDKNTSEDEICKFIKRLGFTVYNPEKGEVNNWKGLTLFGWRGEGMFRVLNKKNSKITIDEFRKQISLVKQN